MIDNCLQGPVLPKFGGGCTCPSTSSFRNISGEYFRKEARGEFQREVIAFGAICITAAVSVLSSIHALSALLRALGPL